ncbi:MAG: extracellular solute-binding protein [Bacilli bacterium]|nr:extracellular solute-binding protein [Bacilli bacterium]
MKNKIKLLGLSLFVVSSLAGCNTNKDDGDVELVYWCFNDQVASFERRLEPFTEKTGIKVRVEGIRASTWAETTQEISTAAYSGTLPDCADMASESMATLVSSNLVSPIDEYVTRDAGEIADSVAEMDPKLYNAHIYNGKRYSLPTIWNAPIMFYNKNVLTKAGITSSNEHYPHSGWTVEDFIYCCNQITKNNTKTGANNVYGCKIENQYFYSIEPWLNSFGTSILNDTWTSSTINSDAAKNCFQTLHDFLNNDDYSKVVSPAMGGTTSYELFFSNRVGFMILSLPYVYTLYNGGFNDSKDAIEKLHQGYDVITFPSVDGISRTLMGVGATAIFKTSKHQEECWQLAKYISSKEFQDNELTETIWAIPSIKSSLDILSQKPYYPKNGKIFYEALENSKIVPAPANYSAIELEVRKWFSGYLSNTSGFALSGNKGNTLDTLAATINSYL